MGEEEAVKNVGIRWSKWFTCDRCGGDYPIEFKATQNGLTVCTYKPCYDRDLEPTDPRAIEERSHGDD